MTAAFCANQIILRSTAASNGCVEFVQLSSSLGTYFDSVGHRTWRGSHALNSPARSWRRASRNSATICGFCAVNQSSSSSRVSTDESTDTGISTMSFGMQSDYQLRLEKQTLLAHALPILVVRRQWPRSPPKATLFGNFFELRTED